MEGLWIEGDNTDTGYKNIRDSNSDSARAIREQLDEMWTQFAPFADRRFREEFALNPDARFWEMCLCVELLSSNKNVQRSDQKPESSPDFLIEDECGRVWIEAVSFGSGSDENVDRVPEMNFDGQVDSVPVRQLELRISNAIDAKIKKFRKYRERNVVQSEDIALIALNPGKLSLQCNDEGRGSPITVLYPLGDQYVTFYRDSAKTSSGYHARLEIEKTQGAPVPIGVLADEKHEDISGVIWSRNSLGNYFLGGHGLTFFPNVTPQNPLPVGWVKWVCEWVITNNDNGEITMTRSLEKEI